MKKLSFVVLLAAFAAISANAQETTQRSDNYPYWTISKGVQRLAYKDVNFLPAKITTGNGAWAVSKGVARLTAEQAPASGARVAMSGYPAWTISKGVARQQYQRSVSK